MDNYKRILREKMGSAALLAMAVHAALAAADDLSNLDLTTLMEMDVTLVTAQKRTEDVNAVPISMTVLKSSAIRGLGLDDTSDLQLAVPGLTTSTNLFWMLPYIRGVGNDINSSGIEPSVAVYVDGVYQAQRVQTLTELSDVEQIEVLRGPQGTLYGRNATGGAINIVTRGPSDHLEGTAELTAGNLDLREGSLFVAGPLNERMRASFSGHARSRAGYYRNLATGDDVLDQDFHSLHGRLQFDVSEALGAELLLKYFVNNDVNGYATQMSANSLPALMGAQVSTEPYQTVSNMPPDNNRLHNTTTALKLTWDLPSVRVQSISAYLDQQHDIAIDFDTSTATLAHFRALEDSNAFTQEIQLSGQSAGRVNWLLGVFYIESSEDFAPLNVTTTLPVLGEVTQVIQGDVHTHSHAAFGEATVALTPSFSLTGGLRYSNEDKQLSDFAAGLQGLPLVSLPKRDKEWDDVNYRLVAKYVQGGSTFYAKTETGFKSGAFNNANPANPGPIDPEQITAYEVGIKTAVPNYPVRLNAAAFYNDYRDLQIQVADQTAGGVTLLVQAPRAETYGVDLSAEVKPAEHWNISAGLNWLQAAYRKFVANGILVPDPAGGLIATSNIDLTGNDLARSPELTANLTVSFDYPVAAGAIFGATNYYRSSRLYFDPANTYSQDAFGVLNAQIGYRSQAHWSISAWAKNLTDETCLSTVMPSQLGGFGIYAAPRTYGLSVGYSFGR
ncbi:MAG TPA: TonB-dependent receptor [Steroidobacteraceae bacterium]|nr:TonB-dependent receptor [Steroidobacteraceae bacterium]